MNIPRTALASLASALAKSARKDGKPKEARKWARIARKATPQPPKSLDRWVIETTAEIPTL